ncbi:glycosyltransferase [Capsulimonas corticalis]|nr:glycosyltransferase [Capsulimonas corticalis]
MTRITWLLPVRNGMPYLPKTLESIANQTYHDWRILAWDNGSTDGTLEELRRWIPDRLPGKIVSDRPLSLGACLAAMVDECDTELCARIDADDINFPERLERQIAFLDAHPDVSVVGSGYEKIDMAGRILEGHPALPSSHQDIVVTMLAENAIAHPTVLFRRNAVIDAGNYADLKPIEDYELWSRMACRRLLANLPEPLIKYRVHRQSVTQQAINSGHLSKEISIHCARSAEALYGCSETDLRLLRASKHPLALAPLIRIARRLGERHSAEKATLLRDPIFLTVAARLIAPTDFISSITLGALDPRVGWKGGLKAALVRLFMLVWSKFPMLHGWLAIYRFQAWRRTLAKQGTVIDPATQIIATKQAYSRIEIGHGSNLERDVSLWISDDDGARARLTLGNDVYVGRNTFLGVYQPISIGADTMIGAYSYIISASHRFDRRDTPIREQGYSGAPIVIEEDVWIGTHVTILPGVTIGRGAIVGAGSMVNKDIPPYEIWGGVPARFIKERPGSA